MVRRRRKNNLLSWLIKPFVEKGGSVHQPDIVLLIVIGLLLFFGLFFLSSASSSIAFFRHGDTYRFVKQQITHGLLPGTLLFYAALRVDYKFYRKISLVFLALSFLFLGLVFIPSLTGGFGTAQSWVSLGSFSFQPSEFVKLFFILFLAGWFDRKGKDIRSLTASTIPFIIILLLISALLIKQPDIGTLSIIIFTALIIYFAAGARWTHFISILVAGAIAFGAMIKAAPYRMHRFVAWINPEADPQGIGWQIKQSLIAIGSGGWFGMGLGASRQKSYLPMPANDSIFAVIAEEIGFVFTVLFLILFILLILRGFKILKEAPDNFAKLVVLGIVAWLSIQVFVNVAGMIQLAPLTGVPLPFISLGGTNLVITLVSMGVLANISKYTNYK
ncbi:cell division protein FtsW [Candidatus Parcubacteria bacterium]|jgi:cell division protein FtsW|nr:cell division protein FtsW [Candidatus Parcubacteria bacterium]